MANTALDFLSREIKESEIKEDPPIVKKEEEGNKGKPSSKDESIAALRAARDAALKEKTALEERLKTLEGLKPLEKVASYLKTKKKKDVVEEVDVDEFIETAKERKKRLLEAEEKAKQKDFQIKELSIEESEEWDSEYRKPIQKAAVNIYTELANVDAEGNVRQDGMVRALMEKIVALDDPTKIKAALLSFKKDYEEASGVDYDPPSVKSLVELIEDFRLKKKNAIEAKKDWDKVREEKNREKIYESSVKEKAFIEKEIQGRNYVYGKFLDGNEFKSAASVIGNEEFAEIVKEEHEFMLKALRRDPDYKQRGYESLLPSLAKGKAFDKLAEKLSQVMSENETLKKKLSSEIPTDFRSAKPVEKEEKVVKKGSPLAFLDK